MVFRIYFKNKKEAEKATLYDPFNACIIEYNDGDNFVTIDLSINEMTASDLLNLFLDRVYDGYKNFISPREEEHVSHPLSSPVMFQIYDDKSKQFIPFELN